MTDPLAGSRGRRLSRFFRGLGFVERHYLIDFQIAAYLKIPYESAQALAPSGTRAYRVDRRHGILYFTYQRMRAGNLTSEALPNGVGRFEELAWGVQVQPGERKAYLPQSLVACGLTATDATARRVMREEDHYNVHEIDGLELRFERRPLQLSARDGDGTVFLSFDLDHVPLPEDAWLLSPVPAEAFKPPTTDAGPVLRYEFVGLALVQHVAGARLPAPSAFHIEPGHPFFATRGEDGEATQLALCPDTDPIPHEIYVTRPDTAALQLLTPSTRWR